MRINLKGNRTIALGVALICYVVISAFNKTEVDQNIVTGLLGAMGITLRLGMKE